MPASNSWRRSGALWLRSGLLLSILLLAAGCSIRPSDWSTLPDSGDGPPGGRLDPNDISDAVPKSEPRSRSGNPSSYVVFGKRYYVMASSAGYRERGIASWYGTKFHGRKTSSGEPYDMYDMTAAHKTLPLPTYVRVTNLKNGRSTVVKVNDRGPFHSNRLIDLSYAAATKLGILGAGTGLVEVEAIDTRQPAPRLAAAPPETVPGSSIPVPRQADDATRLYLQLGAFSQRENAERMIDRINRLTRLPSRIQSVRLDGRALFRVQVGPLPGVEQLDQASLRLEQLGLGETHVIID